MKIYIMTDMEGVCGVVDHDSWVLSSGRYYDAGKKLLTNEVNAAIDGFLRAGADEILVVDGHGQGGIDLLTLDKRAKFLRMLPGVFPFMLDETFDGIAHIGQHAKAGSEYAHIAHTGWFDVLDETINGVSVGEFGQMVYCGAELGVPAFFGTGDQAFKDEAEALVPGIECVAVKRGTTPGSGDECTFEEYKERNLSAIHLHPDAARDKIRNAAFEAAIRLRENPDSFLIPEFTRPFELIRRCRASADTQAYTLRMTGNTVPEVLNNPGTRI